MRFNTVNGIDAGCQPLTGSTTLNTLIKSNSIAMGDRSTVGFCETSQRFHVIISSSSARNLMTWTNIIIAYVLNVSQLSHRLSCKW